MIESYKRSGRGSAARVVTAAQSQRYHKTARRHGSQRRFRLKNVVPLLARNPREESEQASVCVCRRERVGDRMEHGLLPHRLRAEHGSLLASSFPAGSLAAGRKRHHFPSLSSVKVPLLSVLRD
ncbi:hypothetical protein B296_00053241 [Ensete ventricosum]|uniref:Uncharacterized protein n=1 Tax=Ensete ventricosum TaxID=4639 RepID=A0A426XZA7_ENSVE|nr:hypothetical protein B296_00053241 [Ensete ventricosum]